VLRRFNEHLQGTTELMPALISPLCYMLKVFFDLKIKLYNFLKEL